MRKYASLMSACAVPAVLAIVLPFAGCSPKIQEPIVATVGKEAITLSDYEKMYLRSNTSREAAAAATQEEREKFLDLMVKYKLKLSDAYQRGIDQRPEIQQEIEQYKGNLASSYLTERELVQPAVRKMYSRMTEEIRASHILLTFKQNATPEDSALVYQQMDDILKELAAGRDFGDLAVVYSQDPSAKTNRGDLYYFSSGRMVQEFEDAVYSMKKGEITQKPVKTSYGIHIIKILDRKPSSGEVRVSHIMVRFERMNPTPEDTLQQYRKILAIQDSLARGGDFGALAKRNSADGGSASREGDLGWFSRGRWPQPFDEVCFTLKPGEVSPIVRTAYGYHIIKSMETRPLKSFEELKPELQRNYQQQRFAQDYAAYYASIKREVGFVSMDSIRARFLTMFDSTKTVRDSAWVQSIPPLFGRSAIMMIAGKPVTVDSVVSIFKARPDLWNTPLHRTSLGNQLDKITEQLVFSAKANLQEQTDPEFAALLKDYREGILLYQVEQEQVWNNIVANDSVLQAFYAQTRDRYSFPDRVNFTSISSPTEHAARVIYDKTKAGTSLQQIIIEDSLRMAAPLHHRVLFGSGKATLSSSAKKALAPIVREFQSDPALRLRVTAFPDTFTNAKKALALANRRMEAVRKELARMGIATERMPVEIRPQLQRAAGIKDTARLSLRVDLNILGRQPNLLARPETLVLAPAADDRARQADSLQVGTFSAPFPYKVGWTIVRLNAREPARLKTFEEATAEVSSAFQDFEAKRLETAWIDGVRARNPVVEYKQELPKAFAPAQ